MNRKSIQLIIKALDDKGQAHSGVGLGFLRRTVPRTRRANEQAMGTNRTAKPTWEMRNLDTHSEGFMISSDVMALCSINTGCGTVKRRAVSISIGQSGSNDQ